MTSNKLQGHAAMIGANVMWGLMSPAAKMVLATGTVTPILLTDMRIAGAAILFWIASFFTKHEKVPQPTCSDWQERPALESCSTKDASYSE